MKPSRLVLLIVALALVACAAPPVPTPSPTADLPGTPAATGTVSALPSATPAPGDLSTPIPSAGPASPTPEPYDALFDPERISYAHAFSGPQIQAFLESKGSALAGMRIQVGDRSHSFTDVLINLSCLYSISPELLLALMEFQSGLVSSGQPSSDQMGWAFGYSGEGGNRRGLASQLRWATREMRYAVRDYALRVPDAGLPQLSFADGSRQDVSGDISFSRYVLARVIAPTSSPGNLNARLDGFVQAYTRLFGDPRLPPTDWPAPAQPFLTRPMLEPFPVTSFFDHDSPFLRENGSLFTYWGRQETDIAFAYDGHTGWDYAMGPPDPVIAAADGTVIFAGNSDDGCATPARAVILEHGNGYRTLYWHLYQVQVEAGQQVTRGQQIGIAGDSGCAYGSHLHFQVQYLGRDVDPYGWCSTVPDPWAASPAGQVSVWLWADMPSPCGPPAPGVVVVDNSDPGFSTIGEWLPNEVGYGGGSLYAASSFAGSAAQPWRSATLDQPLLASWSAQIPQAGRYRVLVYIPYALNGWDESRELRYLIYHQGIATQATANSEDVRNWWADLGEYEFSAEEATVLTSSLAGDYRRGVWVDAVAFVPVP